MVLSIIWLVAVAVYAHGDIAYAWRYYTSYAELAAEAQARHDEAKRRKARQPEQASSPKNTESHSFDWQTFARDHVPDPVPITPELSWIGHALVFPLGTLLLGAALLWIVRGFRTIN